MLHEVAPETNYARVMRDLSRLKAVKLIMNGKEFVARTELKSDAYLAFKAAGMKPPQRILQL